MKIKAQTEQLAAERFLDFYRAERNIPVIQPVRMKPKGNVRTPDYYLPEIDAFLEIKEIHDRQDLERSAQWAKTMQQFHKYLDVHPLKSEVKGTYLIDTPPFFKFKKDPKNIKEACKKLLEAILGQKEKVSIEQNLEFQITKVGENGNVIGFGTHGPASFISPENTIYENTIKNLKHANEQIKNYSKNPKGGIVLLVNKYHQTSFYGHIFGGLSIGLEDLVVLDSINEIWLEHDRTVEKYELVYDRTFFQNLLAGKLLKTKLHLSLFEKWLYSLANKKDNQYHDQLLNCLKSVLSDVRPDELFKDFHSRQEMVRLGNHFLKKGEYQKVTWLIDKFIDDKDPPISGPNPENNYHELILKGGGTHSITSVVANVAWLVKDLAWHQETIKTSLDYVARLMKHENFYIKVQATFALADIAANRGRLQGQGIYPRTGDYKKFHDLVFYLVDLLENNPLCVEIARRLSDIFHAYTDLTTDEAKRVLVALKKTTRSAGLYIYYAIYRNGHYQGLPIRFDQTEFIEILKNILTNQKTDEMRFRAQFAEQFWRMLKDNPKELEKLKPYIELLSGQSYEKALFMKLELLAEELFSIDEPLAVTLSKRILSTLAAHFKNEPLKPGGEIGFLPSEKLLSSLVKGDVNDYLDVFKNLYVLWEKGSYIGRPQDIFINYLALPNERDKDIAKHELRQIYKSMIRLNPHIKNKVVDEVLK